MIVVHEAACVANGYFCTETSRPGCSKTSSNPSAVRRLKLLSLFNPLPKMRLKYFFLFVVCAFGSQKWFWGSLLVGHSHWFNCVIVLKTTVATATSLTVLGGKMVAVGLFRVMTLNQDRHEEFVELYCDETGEGHQSPQLQQSWFRMAQW